MKKIYYLSTCGTCQKIIDELNLTKKGFVFQDIKTEKITEKQLEEMKKMDNIENDIIINKEEFLIN